MEKVNTFWKIIFFLQSFSNLGLSLKSENPDRLMPLSFIHFTVPFYQLKQHWEYGPKYFTTAILTKDYHKEAVSSPMRDGKRFRANRFPEFENVTSRVFFPAMMSSLGLPEAIFNFISQQLKEMDLKNKWFNQRQF